MDQLRAYILVLFILASATTLHARDVRLVPSANSPNVIRIVNETIFLVEGKTYRYTVDTPVDSGLIETGLPLNDIATQLELSTGTPFQWQVYDRWGKVKTNGYLKAGDLLHVQTAQHRIKYKIKTVMGALSPQLTCQRETITVGCHEDIIFDFVAGQRSPDTKVDFIIPAGIDVTLDNVFVDVIGRGEVSLRQFSRLGIGRGASHYEDKRVGSVQLSKISSGGHQISFSDIDLRPSNGVDLRLRIRSVVLPQVRNYVFVATYTTSKPDSYTSFQTAMATVSIRGTKRISDLRLVAPKASAIKTASDLNLLSVLQWTTPRNAKKVSLLISTDRGQRWEHHAHLPKYASDYRFKKLEANTLYQAKLVVEGGPQRGESNRIEFYSGPVDVKQFGVEGNGKSDDSEKINAAIALLSRQGGGILSFDKGDFLVRTVLLKSNVWLHIGKNAVLRGLSPMNGPETTWFSDKAYRYGLSPTDTGPYDDPENYLTKQDVGHSFFQNSMFFAERQVNIRIIGNGRISGNGNLVTGDKVMDNVAGRRADKMFTFKLCRNIEVGGFANGLDMWYDEQRDEPYYIRGEGPKDFDTNNVLHIDQAGHFAVLATGTDTIHVHDTYFGQASTDHARDIYDFMGCNAVTVSNIYSRLSADDIVKLGSDCSLGFTRPSRQHLIRDIIGDTNCNLFQIGSETADDITDVYVDNIYVLGANKAGFSISTNDGGTVKNVFLNTGHTGKLHSRSKMLRCHTPIFISISNRGRVLGATVKRFRFKENEKIRDELLCTNVNIGHIENIVLQHVDIAEAYAGSSFRSRRWKGFDGSQGHSAAIIAGYSLPENTAVEGGLTFSLPNGKSNSYITSLKLKDINLLVKGGNPHQSSDYNPPELGVGKYNVKDFGVLPAYGLWIRHARDMSIVDCTIKTEQADRRKAIILDDATHIIINGLESQTVDAYHGIMR
ncbi:endopygalactorunase [Sphingobacterium sp.]|uniref:endopygalactorunase n=1 Tax=Sphingobacterium sp. TaxID=341027 RepID=UPI0031D90AA5